MMIGLRKPFWRIDLDGLAPVHVGQAHIHDGEIDPVALHRLDGACRRVSAVATWNSS